MRTLISLSLGLALLTIAWLLLDPKAAVHARDIAVCLTDCLYWINGPLATALLVFLLWIGLGARRDLRLSGQQSPAFGFGAWLAMLVTAGLGSGLVFWGGIEPLRSLTESNAEVGAASAFAALARAQFHWGPQAWIWALACALLIGLRAPGQPPSNLYSSVFSRAAAGSAAGVLARTLIDLGLILGAVFALLATLPLAARVMTAGLARLTGQELGPTAAAAVLIAVAALAALSALAGLKRGIRSVALTTSAVFIALLAYVWIGGGPLEGSKVVIANLGETASRFVSLSFATDPFGASGNGWRGDWLQDDFIRWMLSAPVVGLFIARISRGRTVRELLIAGLLIPSLAGFVWISLAGGHLLRLAMAGEIPVDSASPRVPDAWALFAHLPLEPLGLTLALLAACGLLVAMLDSSIHALASMTTTEGREPSWRMRLYWSLALGLLPLGLLSIQGDAVIQAIALIAGGGTLLALVRLTRAAGLGLIAPTATARNLAADKPGPECRDDPDLPPGRPARKLGARHGPGKPGPRARPKTPQA